MNKSNRLWVILFIIGAVLVAGRMLISQSLIGKAYVQAVQINPDEENEDHKWTLYEQSSQTKFNEAVLEDPNQTEYLFSFSRTIGVWIAALLTMFILSFLIRDNPLYKFSESVFIGISAAYWMVVGFWSTVVPNLLGKLSPDMVRDWAMPGLGIDERVELMYIVPLVLGLMLLWILSPKGGWISRWPTAFIIGVFCGLRLITFIHADFLSQIRNGIAPIYVKTMQTAADGSAILDAAGSPVMGFDFWESLRNVFLIIGVLSCLVYFFFSFEHKGIVGKTAKLGIWFMMITFGAAFGYTVMGRIALLAIRLEFLFDDWLWLIDPTGKRLEAVISMLGLF